MTWIPKSTLLVRDQTNDALRRCVPAEGFEVERIERTLSKDIVVISTTEPKYSVTVCFTFRCFRPGYGVTCGRMERPRQYKGAGWRDRLIADALTTLYACLLSRSSATNA